MKLVCINENGVEDVVRFGEIYETFEGEEDCYTFKIDGEIVKLRKSRFTEKVESNEIIILEAINRYGIVQLDIAQEELAELIQAISKYKRYGTKEEVLEEVADVEIMIKQIKQLLQLDSEEIEKVKDKKLKRLERRMLDEKYKEMGMEGC